VVGLCFSINVLFCFFLRNLALMKTKRREGERESIHNPILTFVITIPPPHCVLTPTLILTLILITRVMIGRLQCARIFHFLLRPSYRCGKDMSYCNPNPNPNSKPNPVDYMYRCKPIPMGMPQEERTRPQARDFPPHCSVPS